MVNALFVLVIYLLAAGILIALAYYVLDAVPVPDPFNRWIKLIIVVLAGLILVAILLGMVGEGSFSLPRITG